MKKALYILGVALMTVSLKANAQELVPDQNPNYQNSAQKYAERSDDLTANQSETVQDTYKAYDWREAKAEAKQQRIDRRYELRKMRYQSRNRCYNNYRYRRYNNGYYNNGYNYNGFNNGYNNYYNGCNNGYYNNGVFGTPNLGGVVLGAGLGYGLFSILN